MNGIVQNNNVDSTASALAKDRNVSRCVSNKVFGIHPHIADNCVIISMLSGGVFQHSIFCRDKGKSIKVGHGSLFSTACKRLNLTFLLLFITLFTASGAFADDTREEKKFAIAPFITILSAPAPEPETAIMHAEAVDTVQVVKGNVTGAGSERKPFYMDIRSNMLYDVLALPNIGIDFYVGKNISVGANWMYAWWGTRHAGHFWRACGGEVNGRWWFGKVAHRKPLTGLHLGLYAQYYTYDFLLDGKGQMGGRPDGNPLEKGFWGVGLDFGYSMPIGKRFNIDFSLGVGYTQGNYHKYKPVDNHFVWQSTSKRKFFGPTKAEVSLVWLIGCDNINRKKGGGK